MDLIFYILSYFIIRSSFSIINQSSKSIINDSYGEITSLSTDQLQILYYALKSFIATILSSLIIAALLILLLYTITKASIWLYLSNKKPTLKLYLKYLITNLATFGIAAILIFISLSFTNYKWMFSSIILFLLFHINLNFYYQLPKGKLSNPFRKCYNFIIPYLIMSAIIFLIYLISTYLTSFYLFLALLILALNWGRIYLIKIMKSA